VKQANSSGQRPVASPELRQEKGGAIPFEAGDC